MLTFWLRFYIVVLGMISFFSGHILFFNFYLDFCFPFIILPFILLFIWTFISLSYLEFVLKILEKRLKGIFDQCSGGQSCTLVSMCARNSNLESYLVSRYECCAPEVVIENSKYVFGLLLTLSHIWFRTLQNTTKSQFPSEKKKYQHEV
jgi:hypothetical protein